MFFLNTLRIVLCSLRFLSRSLKVFSVFFRVNFSDHFGKHDVTFSHVHNTRMNLLLACLFSKLHRSKITHTLIVLRFQTYYVGFLLGLLVRPCFQVSFPLISILTDLPLQGHFFPFKCLHFVAMRNLECIHLFSDFIYMVKEVPILFCDFFIITFEFVANSPNFIILVVYPLVLLGNLFESRYQVYVVLAKVILVNNPLMNFL